MPVPDTQIPPWPSVSVVVPVLNEEAHLADAVAMITGQDYPGEVEIVLAIGPSRDRTDEVAARLAQADPRIRVVPNPTGRTPAALNAAIANSHGEIVARVDGHAEIPPDYLTIAVRTLLEQDADNVGGVMYAAGRTPFERAVATAMRSPIGVGNASFHVGGAAGEADTVYLGVFRRAALERVGGFDEHFERAQDWEMNLRVRRTGGRIWFTPDLVVTYRPRGTPRALARQYFQYGTWRHVIARHHTGSINLRYLAPPAMVLGTTAATLLGLAWRPALAIPAGYAAAVTLGGLAIGRGDPPAARALTPIALAIMHWSWGIGYLSSPRRLATGRRDAPGTPQSVAGSGKKPSLIGRGGLRPTGFHGAMAHGR
ncbi:MAG: glycosyltransferase family 2 protein [Tetrasphaera sp.]